MERLHNLLEDIQKSVTCDRSVRKDQRAAVKYWETESGDERAEEIAKLEKLQVHQTGKEIRRQNLLRRKIADWLS